MFHAADREVCLSATFDTVDHDTLVYHLQQSSGVKTGLSWIESFTELDAVSQHQWGQSNTSPLTCGMLQESVLCPVLFFVHCADVFAIDNTQLYFHADSSTVNSKAQKMVTCVGDIGRWMCAHRLKLNQDKTEFQGWPTEIMAILVSDFKSFDLNHKYCLISD